MPANPPDATNPPMLVRWRRYGHDRAYVKVGDDDLGYRDLKTGDVHCERAGARDLIVNATAALFAQTAQARAAAEYRPRHSRPDEDLDPTPPVAEPTGHTLLPDRDLATNRAGEAARAQSRQLLAQAPVRMLIARAVGVKTEERNWHVGAQGEEEVGRRLATLGPHWRVLHAVPVGEHDSDIDHVVLGPGGVFTVNVKNHPQAKVWVRGDTFKVNNFNQYYVRNSRHEARRAAKLLSTAAQFDVEVGGIIAVVGAQRGYTVKQQPADGAVTVVRGGDLVRHLRTVPQVLGEPSIERIYSVARHLATWKPGRVGWSEFGLPV